METTQRAAAAGAWPTDRENAEDGRAGPTRREVLLGAAATAGVVVLAACSPAEAPSGSGLTELRRVPVGGALSARSSAGDPIVIAQPSEGEVVAFSAICTHQGCTVQPSGAELVCPCHGSVFESATGRNVSGPAPRPLEPFPVRLDGDRVVES